MEVEKKSESVFITMGFLPVKGFVDGLYYTDRLGNTFVCNKHGRLQAPGVFNLAPDDVNNYRLATDSEMIKFKDAIPVRIYK